MKLLQKMLATIFLSTFLSSTAAAYVNNDLCSRYGLGELTVHNPAVCTPYGHGRADV